MSEQGVIRIGPWTLDLSSGEIEKGGARLRLPPKAAALLALLAASPGKVVAREEITDALWPGVTVGEDSLARLVSTLRKSLGDDPKDPRFIETLPKRGYRLAVDAIPVDDAPMAAPAKASKRLLAIGAALLLGLIALVAVFSMTVRGGDKEASAPNPLIARADDFYFQYTREDNEAAITLYERAIAASPDDPNALAGLANALVQRAMRWPVSKDDTRGEITMLGAALESGRLEEPAARRHVERALLLAADAVRIAPDSAAALKALGLAQSAAGRFDDALRSYEAALAINADAWGVLINVADVLEITGRGGEALPYFERAYEAMSRAYSSESARIRPWQARLGVAIAERHSAGGDTAGGENWYRAVLSLSPFDREATRGLAGLLRASGSAAEADQLCRALADHSGGEGC
ncbi:MAG TPA: winged helix-turn-helix domain-containing protein [Parvularculaceae bacterium]|nr:winged helix-turn-helix domain-containing protein [Amphiplicatus sp.]MCB9955198.1 winged helix-turn-helix domain-containing protein [Caulobacterales bacterium]HPE29737.1 winged helix-turn-helix domain-containing protein [Parvularculaceae bacterium]HRX40487.1 winged helix-turn-helix domain-containing protein [Parvularculaceae bacterium]